MRIFACALLLVAGCAKTPSGGGQDLATIGNVQDGGAAHDLAPLATGDMVHPLAGISCGAQQCGASSQYCCTVDKGNSGDCHATNDFNCSEVFFFCDGPEDCPQGLAECCIVNGNASCVSTGECAQMSGTLMCHKSADCTAGQSCCNAPKSPYSLCLDQACP